MESFLDNLKKKLQCSLCNDTLTEPKLLQCFHTFCKSCIQRHAQLQEQVHTFKCPTCSSETSFQELSNVEDLQPSPLHSRMLRVLEYSENEKCCSVSETHSPALWQCLDCDQSLCDECLKCHAKFTTGHRVVSLSEVKKEDLEPQLRRESPCKTHLNNNVELFCKDCEALVCLLCLKDGHNNHKTSTLQEIVALKNNLLSKNLEEIERLERDEVEKKQQEEIAVKIKDDAEKAQNEVKKITKKIVKFFIDQEQQLLNEIEKCKSMADRNLRVIRHIPAAQEYMKSIMKEGTASDMVESCKEFIYEPFKSDIAGLVFCPDENLYKDVNKVKLGKVRQSLKSNPIFSEIQVDLNLKALQKAKLSVVTKTSTENLNYDDCDVVDIQISPADDVKVEDKTVKTDGKIEVEFIPRVAGQFTAEVKLNGIPVSNSPLVFDIKPQEMKELEDSQLIQALNTGPIHIMGIAVNKTKSRIAVADFSLHCVRVFNSEGEVLLVYGGKGSEPGKLLDPHGLAFLNNTDLVIVERGNNRLCIVNTLTGTLVKTFGCLGNGNGEFSNPRGAHVDDDCNIIVSDTGNGRVQFFTKDGDYQYQLTVPDVENFKPYSTVTHNGLFYVSDRNNGVVHVIQMKDDSATRLFAIGNINDNDDSDDDDSDDDDKVGQLLGPCGLAIDNDNNLLVCDHKSKSIKKFTLDGRFVGQTGSLKANLFYIEVLNDGQCICTLTCGLAIIKH